MSFREAAVLPVAYLTAYILLFDIGNIKPGQTLFFHSAGGGVGGMFLFCFISYSGGQNYSFSPMSLHLFVNSCRKTNYKRFRLVIFSYT